MKRYCTGNIKFCRLSLSYWEEAPQQHTTELRLLFSATMLCRKANALERNFYAVLGAREGLPAVRPRISACAFWITAARSAAG